MSSYELKSLDLPDEQRKFDKGHVDVVMLGDHSIGRTSLEAGWKWSTAVKPLVGTDLCQVSHVGVCTSGRLAVKMSDGSEFQIRDGDAYAIPSGHDAWVESDEVFTGIEFESLAEYAKPR